MERFEQAEHRAIVLGRPTMAATARVLPALHLSRQLGGHLDDAAQLLGPAEAALTWLQLADAHWYLLHTAERAVATACLATGHAARALALAEHTASRARNRSQRAKALLLVGRARAELGRADAGEALDDAATTFLEEGADLWAVDALLELAEADPEQAPRALDLAYQHTRDEVAFRYRWQQRPPFVIELPADGPPRFLAGGEQLSLGIKGQQLAQEVVLAGPDGVRWEQVAEVLWPGDDEADRVMSRLTSLTALVRRRLGSEGWRLRRDGPRFEFVDLGVTIVRT